MKTFLQFTDCHLNADASASMQNVVMDQSLQQVIQKALAQHGQPDGILLTGDLSHDGSPEAYQRLQQHFSVFECPIYWIPGNHDDINAMAASLSETFSSERCVDTGAWRIILLDSKWGDAIPGYLSPEQLQFCRDSLASAGPDQSIMVVLHHHVIEPEVMDAPVLLANANQLFKVLKEDERVKVILGGHVHHEREQRYCNMRVISTPSTCFQYRPVATTVVVDDVPPGYRCLQLHDSGEIDTVVERI